MATTPLDEMETILNALFDFAQKQLERRGVLAPFARAIAADGSLEAIGVLAEDTHKGIDLLYGGLAQQAESGAIRAAGVCVDVLTTLPGESRKTDALRADVEHAAHEPLRALLPYRKKPLRRYEWGQLIVESGESRLHFRGRAE